MFSIRVKVGFDPINLQRKANGFSLFSKAFSWETDLLSNARWFYGKRCKIGKGNQHLTENWDKTKGGWTADNHNYMCYICPKGFLDSNFN